MHKLLAQQLIKATDESGSVDLRQAHRPRHRRLRGFRPRPAAHRPLDVVDDRGDRRHPAQPRAHRGRAHQGAAGAGKRIARAEHALRRRALQHVARPGDVRRRRPRSSSAINATSPCTASKPTTSDRAARCATCSIAAPPAAPSRAIPNTISAVCARRSKPELPTTEFVELDDGRTIAIVSQPMAGGGWVATHEDVTERRRAGNEDRPHGAPRRADRSAEPRAAARAAERGARPRRARAAARGALSRSRSVQERQRFARPPDRRRTAARGGGAAARLRRGDRHDLAASAATSSASSRPRSATRPTRSGWRGASPKRSGRRTICTAIWR